ncbi:uncharacterized protein LOC113525157 [Pangasianodon hypophthalmus]|uniref:uncharacterized protein LOC113525157 n=1 Tax=Pangasianodon hypophthalmus TaxID=310915 RepID=UPI000F000F27|nr:uncharacterized protein LOC113525157 [Pangasianodon hypophthalmus]XP_034164476.1 uncharacterized protein LOC113525157 [Pangasianodon hypophthalmus]
MAEKIENEEEEESLSDEELEPLSVDDYQMLLQLLKINLPKGALNPEVSQRLAHPDVIKDSKTIVQDLRNAKITVVDKPRLSCVKVKRAYDLKERGKITDIIQILFFKTCKKASENSLKKRWEKNAPKSGCRFRMRGTFNETPISTPEKWLSSAGAGKAWFGNPEDNKNNATDCFGFFLREKGLDIEGVKYRREYPVESGFISGRLDFLLDITDPAGSSETSLSEKIIIECKGTKGNMVGDVFTLPHDESHQAEFNKSHEYYYQTQAYLYILKKELTPVPVRAVMVVKLAAEDKPKFYWGEVSDDTEHIEKLNHFCQEEALPRFLAVLNLIFRKVKERGGAGVMERDGEMESISSS